MLFRRKLTIFFLSFFIFAQGCVPVLVGLTGVVTGYTLSNDAAIGTVKADYSSLWKTSLETLEKMDAEILETKQSAGTIKAIISETKVAIKIDTITSDAQRLKVSARKSLLPKPHFAQKVFLNIIENLK